MPVLKVTAKAGVLDFSDSLNQPTSLCLKLFGKKAKVKHSLQVAAWLQT